MLNIKKGYFSDSLYFNIGHFGDNIEADIEFVLNKGNGVILEILIKQLKLKLDLYNNNNTDDDDDNTDELPVYEFIEKQPPTY